MQQQREGLNVLLETPEKLEIEESGEYQNRRPTCLGKAAAKIGEKLQELSSGELTDDESTEKTDVEETLRLSRFGREKYQTISKSLQNPKKYIRFEEETNCRKRLPNRISESLQMKPSMSNL